MTTNELTFWSVTGQKLATYQINGDGSLTQIATWYYFGKKLIKNAGGYVGADRLGSIGHFYPWGQEKPSATTNGTEKFTGYFRDAETGFDYAKNRYQYPGTGRFLTPDPYAATPTNATNPADPGSWNRYAHVGGDPVNRVDPTGRDYCDPDDASQLVDTGCDGSGTGYGGAPYCPANYVATGNGDCEPVDEPPSPAPASPVITLKEIDDCIFKGGTSISPGSFTLEVEYQVLVNGSPVYGNSSLNALGISISETVVTTSGGPIIGSGKWCPVGGTCGTAGSMSPNGSFWDVLAGNGTANQTFFFNGIPVAVVNFSGQPTVLQNTYNSKGQSISIANGSLTGNSSTRPCGKDGDPGWRQ